MGWSASPSNLASVSTTVDMPVLPGVLVPGNLRRTIQVWFAFEPCGYRWHGHLHGLAIQTHELSELRVQRLEMLDRRKSNYKSLGTTILNTIQNSHYSVAWTPFQLSPTEVKCKIVFAGFPAHRK